MYEEQTNEMLTEEDINNYEELLRLKNETIGNERIINQLKQNIKHKINKTIEIFNELELKENRTPEEEELLKTCKELYEKYQNLDVQFLNEEELYRFPENLLALNKLSTLGKIRLEAIQKELAKRKNISQKENTEEPTNAAKPEEEKQTAKLLKAKEYERKIEENNQKLTAIGEDIKECNKMVEALTTRPIENISGTLKSVNKLLNKLVQEQQKLSQENNYLLGAVRYLRYDLEIQKENLYDRLWANALKENELRDAAAKATTEEERKQIQRRAHAYAMNNARWNANPIKSEYLGNLDQYKTYLRNEMGKILGIEPYEGIEDADLRKYHLDSERIKHFSNLADELYILNGGDFLTEEKIELDNDDLEGSLKRVEQKGKDLVAQIKKMAHEDADVMKKIQSLTQKPEEPKEEEIDPLEKIKNLMGKEKEPEEVTAIVPVKPPTPIIEEVDLNDDEPEEREVKAVRKTKNKEKLRWTIKAKISKLIPALILIGTLTAGALGIHHMTKKAAPDIPRTATEDVYNNDKDNDGLPDIEIQSNSGMPVTGTDEQDKQNDTTQSDLEYLDDTNVVTGTKPITPITIQQALIDSGMMTNSGENEQEIINGTGKGISPKKLKYYDHNIYFEDTNVPEVSHIVEVQPDGTEVRMKHVPTSLIPKFIESLSKQSNQSKEDLYNRYVVKKAAKEQVENNTTVEVNPQPEVLKQALIDSGAIRTSANDEYSAINSNGTGIKAENLQYWYDQGKILKFTRDAVTNAYLVKEPQKDGREKALGWWQFDAVERYFKSIAINTDADFDELFQKQTGESHSDAYNAIYNKRGVSR